MHGCAVGGGSITYANTLLVPRRFDLGERIVGGPGGLEGGDAAALRRPPCACWASRKTGFWVRRTTSCSGRRKSTGQGRPSTAPGCGLRRAGGRAAGPDLSRPVFRRRRTGARQLHRLRRLHDGVPLWRQEYAGPELPLPCRERRARRSSPRPGWWMCGPWTAVPDGSQGYEVLTVPSTARAGRAAPLHLPRRGVRGVGAGHAGPALPAEGKGLAAGDQRATGQPRAHQCRVADRRARARHARRICRRGLRSVRASTWTHTRTSRPRAIRRGPTPWGCWRPS